MIYFLIITLLLLLLLFWFAQLRILLPQNIDAILEAIKKEGLPEMMSGKLGYAQNGFVKICYETMGEAHHGTILLLNGHSQTMLGYPPWFFQPLVEAGYQVIRMDNRGTGLSSWMENWTKATAHTLEDMAEDSIAVLDALQVEKAHVIGYSMGGMIGQRLAISYPNRVQSLTSAMSSGYYDDPALTGLSMKYKLKIVLVFLTYVLNLKTVENRVKLHLAVNQLLKGEGYDFEYKEIAQKAFYEDTKRRGYNMKVEPQHTSAIRLSGSRYEELQQLTVPTLVIHGTGDPLVLFENAEKYAPMIPNVKTHYVEGLGHHFSKQHTPEIIDAVLNHIGHPDRSEKMDTEV